MTFYGRLGGKSRIANHLISLFPTDMDTFVEVFLGAGNILMRLNKDQFKTRAVNDLDKMVYYLFKDIQEINEINLGDVNVDAWKRIKRQLEWVFVAPPAQRFGLLLNHVWFSYGGMCGSFDKKKADTGDKRVKALMKKLNVLKDHLRGVEIHNHGYDEMIQKFKDDEKAFIYCDPPYYQTKGYKHDINHEDLKRQLDGCKGKWMVSYNDHPYIRELYQDYHITTLETAYTIKGNHKRQTKTEIIITNYAI